VSTSDTKDTKGTKEAKDTKMSATASPEPIGMFGELARLTRALQRYGVGECVRLAAGHLRRLAYLRESHVWYRLELPQDLQPIGLPPGFEVVRAEERDLHLLEQLPSIGPRAARRRLADGADLWIARQGGRAAFACWIFHRKTPAAAARCGWLNLPPRTAALEDSIVAPAFQGRGLAPAAWAAIAEVLALSGVEAIVTKVDETDLRCRRAIERVGFRAVASMQLSRIGGHARVALHLHEESTAGFLSAQLAR
jgi:RimJ/RimL family protein N-acetyltransferase